MKVINAVNESIETLKEFVEVSSEDVKDIRDELTSYFNEISSIVSSDIESIKKETCFSFVNIEEILSGTYKKLKTALQKIVMIFKK